MRAVAIERDDGGVSVMILADDQADVAAHVATWQATTLYKTDPDTPGTPVRAVAWHVVDPATIPQSKRWRKAWRFVAGKLAVDLPTARQVRKAEVLALRDARLARVRTKAAAAQEDGSNALLAALRQRAVNLRGLDTSIDADLAALSDLAALDSYQPSIFAGNPD